MAEGAARSRPPLGSTDTLDSTKLTGSLSQDGTTAALSVDETTMSNAAPLRPAKEGTQARDFGARSQSEPVILDEGADSSDDTIEDYDDLELDPDTLVANSRKSMDAAYKPLREEPEEEGEDSGSRPYSAPGPNGKHKKRNSIQIRLERTDRKGRYTLTADDPEIRSILRKGIEREEVELGNRKPRRTIRDLVFTRQFTTFDRQNPTSSESPFFGFFTLFWIGMVLLFVRVSMQNYRDYGSILGSNQIAKMMFSHDVLVLGLTDGAMCGSAILEGYLFQTLVQKGYINWAKGGWIIQNLWQSLYLGSLVGWAYFREWPWTHTIFAVLHGLVFVMKQHSYNFYNGYLSGVYRRRTLLETRLRNMQTMEPAMSAPTSPSGLKSKEGMSSGLDLAELTQKTSTKSNEAVKRRPSMGHRTSTNLHVEKSDVASVAQLIESGRSIDVEQMKTFESVIRAEIDDLNRELLGKATSPYLAYPHNLTLTNMAEFICLPTLVYELDYPRQDHINWWYVLEKTTATFGVLCVMMVISQAFIYPPVAKTMLMKEAGMPIEQRWQEFPFIVSDMLFPLLIEQLLTWYLIWECILNVLAEITRFADRGFYGDWWNSVTWDQYARDWNRPVHNFLLRHVYHSSISTFHLSRNAATFATFLLSALVHEMCMAIMFKKVRGYLFWMQLLQMPLVMVSRSKLLKGRVVLGNVIFWMGLFVGPSFLTSLYLVI
ncbi:hypothetical protein B0A50_07187 [Salinomyces thailandicus]|uniref:O-acyltransferase n=1 Tax=Salinomyces thailandicus TaxID=706561 RepID=A0A4U0TMP5_9PEZI|nr:hypothetical protein B0A50_07187 [Salinomyces thailandica]